MVLMHILSRAPNKAKKRFPFLLLLLLAIIAGMFLEQPQATQEEPQISTPSQSVTKPHSHSYELASDGLEALAAKGRAPKTGYKRSLFGDGWAQQGLCDTRNIILARDLKQAYKDVDNCTVLSGILHDPYTGKEIVFVRGSNTSSLVQIDHVVALSDAWQKGAQQLTPTLRVKFANDGLNLLAVDGGANQSKGDGDAATWLPSNKAIRCSYVARQISVKLKYSLWVTAAEKDAMQRILRGCPDQKLEG